jgi:hypothetical protein
MYHFFLVAAGAGPDVFVFPTVEEYVPSFLT